MDKRLDFLGVNPNIRLDQILIDSNEHRPAITAMMNSYAVGTNPNFIIDCDITAESIGLGSAWTVSEGYIFLNGEILKVDAQSGTYNSEGNRYLVFNKETTYDTRGIITYLDGTPRQTWQKNRGVITEQGTSGTTTQLNALTGDRLDDKIKAYTGIALTDPTAGLQTKIIEIGDWNMDTTTGLNKNHGLTLGDIRSISVIIIDDTGAASIPLDYDLGGTGASGNYLATSTQIQLLRTTGGVFDNAGYNSTSYNRGWITIQYVA